MQAAYRVEAELLGSADFFPLRRTVADVVDSKSIFFGIACPEKPASLAAVIEVEVGETACNIAALVVRPDRFREGLGSKLLRHVLELYSSQPCTVSTGRANEPALKLYAGHGFRETSRWVTEDGIAMVTLARRASS